MERASQFRPLADRVLLRKLEPEATTKGGLVIPESAQGKERASRAEVVAVGPGAKLESGVVLPCTLKHGDEVLVAKWTGHEVDVAGEKHLVLSEGEILAVIE